MPTHRKEIYELIERLEAIAFANPHKDFTMTITAAEVCMLVDELRLRTGLAQAAITARIQRRG